MASSGALKAQKQQKIKERDLLVTRKKGVDKIISNIDSCFGDPIAGINSRISACSVSIENGVKGNPKVNRIIWDLSEEEEKSTSVDRNMSSGRANLSYESSRCQQRIDVLNTEINSLDGQIKAAEAAEAEARRKALEKAVGIKS